MKKRTMAFGGLMMAVAVTAYSVSGTYAKYISSVDAIDDARVAKFEVAAGEGVKTENINLFKDVYQNKDGKDIVQSLLLCNEKTAGGKYEITTDEDAKSEGWCKNVVAPGTQGEYQFYANVTSEVNYTLSIISKVYNYLYMDVNFVSDYLKPYVANTTITEYDENGENPVEKSVYSPILFRVGKVNADNSRTYNDGGYVAADKLEEEAKNFFNTTDVYAPTVDGKTETYVIEWKWDFEAPAYSADVKSITGKAFEGKTLTDEDGTTTTLTAEDVYKEYQELIDRLDTDIAQNISFDDDLINASISITVTQSDKEATK